MRPSTLTAIVALAVALASCDGGSSAPGAPTKTPVQCCKLGAPSCNCTVIGTRDDGSCETICDAAPVAWTTVTDDNGCPRYVFGSQSCYPPPGWSKDAGKDASEPALGTACTFHEDCDTTGSGAICAVTNPTPVCVTASCEGIAEGAKCEGGRGACAWSYCMPICTFGDDGAAPVGCPARTACNFAARDVDGDAGLDASTAPRGFGYCFGGCVSDVDCAPDRSCQREFGLCDGPAFSKTIGQACVAEDLQTGKCLCTYGAAGTGYCSRACRIETNETCPTDYACDAKLPADFAKAPRDMGGECKKICTTDADCVNSKCVAAGGLSVKVCRPT